MKGSIAGVVFDHYTTTLAPKPVAVAATPVVLGALGFTAGGIAASSIASSMMSAAAVANGGGVAAGSLVATLQSVGAAGLAASTNAILGTAGAGVGALVARLGRGDILPAVKRIAEEDLLANPHPNTSLEMEYEYRFEV
ncbi:interferon alpha-inducible protein 27-like protein 2A [Ochotona curzoniae]|uniref:interferon alpha-inducible protein 27-like protein 2A n=1 Tax=Ochotona curzoniae TaxID=130825 RepID=UPI001B34D057|nr:interferon alpha-inducible protein 27-like protein 2A [Ochotona curzoniae]